MARPADRSIRAYKIIWFGKNIFIFKMATSTPDILPDICQEQENLSLKKICFFVAKRKHKTEL
jgi:hypothetical protein